MTRPLLGPVASRDRARLRAAPVPWVDLGNLSEAILSIRAEPTREGPLPFTARLVTSGTLSALLRTVDLVLGTLLPSQETR